MKAIVVVGILVMCTAARVSAESADGLPPPDPVLQMAIDNAARESINAKTAEEADRIAQALKPGSLSQTQLLEQFVYYLRHSATNEEQGYGALLLVNRLQFNREETAKTILSHLDTPDPGTRKILEGFLGLVDSLPDKTCDFSIYAALLREKKPEIPARLVQYMYERDPQAAVLAIAQVYALRPVEPELESKIHGDAKEALKYLGSRSEWWAHLYVAEMMKRDRWLRDPAIVKKLEADSNPLVQEKVAEIMSVEK
ncbi:MAG: hypothetical protein AB7V14_10875 [Kiritimatiellia bacterium]